MLKEPRLTTTPAQTSTRSTVGIPTDVDGVAATGSKGRSPCSECGAEAEHVIGCPDGAEICQDCFDAGGH